MNQHTSKVDPKLKAYHQRLVKKRVDFNIHDHHKTELVDDNFHEVYKVDFKPQRNSHINNRQSSGDRSDPADPMNPLKVGYQYAQDEMKSKENRKRSRDADQFQIGSEVLGGSP